MRIGPTASCVRSRRSLVEMMAPEYVLTFADRQARRLRALAVQLHADEDARLPAEDHGAPHGRQDVAVATVCVELGFHDGQRKEVRVTSCWHVGT